MSYIDNYAHRLVHILTKFFLPNIIFFFYLSIAFIKHLNHNIIVVGEEKWKLRCPVGVLR